MTKKHNVELSQHYLVWRSFNQKIFKKTLTADHIVGNGNEKFIDVVQQVVKNDSGTYHVEENKSVNTKCIFLEKDGIKYILPSSYQQHLPINVKKGFECYLKNHDKTIYQFIEEPKIAKIGPEKTLSLKELMQVFNNLPHTNNKSWIFLRLQAIGSKAKGCKYRLCSVPNSGKNSTDTVLNFITNNNVKVSKPTLAKLETLFYYNQKVIPDEMTSLTPADVNTIEPFFLTIADEAPTFTKHSMAQRKDMNNVDISQASCVFTYNEPKNIAPDKKFFDDIWQNKDAFNSRYPALHIQGEIIASLPKLSVHQAEEVLEEHFDAIKRITKNLIYYIENMTKELKGFDRSRLNMVGRHKTNFEGVIDALEVYCDTQDEFDDWIDWVNESVNRYKMITGDQQKAFAKGKLQ